MARLTHEEKVERFYSHGAALRAAQDGGLLSFGYWTESTVDYRQATEDLLARVLKEETPAHCGTVLNVACGNGMETFRIWEAPEFLPPPNSESAAAAADGGPDWLPAASPTSRAPTARCRAAPRT